MRLLHCAVVALLSMLWAGPAGADPLVDMGVVVPKVHLPAPDFELAGLEGGRQRLSQYRGKLVLLHFWATWCAPCRTEMPQLHQFWRAFRSRGLELVCVNVDRGNREGVDAFMQEIGLHFHTLLDPGGEVRNRYEVFALPTSYLIGRDGKIIGRIIGERDWSSKEAAALIRKLFGSDAGTKQ